MGEGGSRLFTNGISRYATCGRGGWLIEGVLDILHELWKRFYGLDLTFQHVFTCDSEYDGCLSNASVVFDAYRSLQVGGLDRRTGFTALPQQVSILFASLDCEFCKDGKVLEKTCSNQ